MITLEITILLDNVRGTPIIVWRKLANQLNGFQVMAEMAQVGLILLVRKGTVVKGKPSVGWAASMQGGIGGSAPPYGHVAVVEYVNSDGSILVSEANVINQGSGTRSWRVLDRATVEQIDFIQGKGA